MWGWCGHVRPFLAVVYEHQPSSGTSFSTFGFGSKAIFHYYRYLLYVVAAAPRAGSSYHSFVRSFARLERYS